MITVTVTIISFLCIQSSNSNISVPVVPTDNHTESAGGQTERYSGEVLVTTTTRITVSEINVTDRPAEQIQDALFTNFQSLQTPEVTFSELKNDSNAEFLQMIYSKSLNNNTVQDNSFDVMPVMHNTSTAITVQPYSAGTVFAEVNSTAINKNLYPTINYHISDNNNSTISDNDEKYKLKEIPHTQIYPAKIREVKHNKMVDKMTVTNDIVAAKKGATTGQLNLYDLHLPNKMHDYSYTEDHISADEIGWKTIGRPENTKPITSWAGGMDIWNQPSHGIGNHGYNELSLPNRVIKDHRTPIQQKEKKIDWHTISIKALIKLGLVKLKAIGFLKILFLILFKIKLYMIAVFVKFLLIMKLMKFSKMLILPLLILQLLPTLVQLLLMRSSNSMINLPGNTLQNQPGNLLSGVTSLPGGTTGTGLTGGTTGIGLTGGTAGTGLSGGTTGTGLPGGTAGTGLPGGTTGTGLPSTTTGTGRPGITTRTVQIGEKKLSSFKVHDLNLISKQQNESSMMFDPTWEIFQKVLDSEKCIERIACQISVAEKAGVMPFWINWIIYHISTLIPGDKLETYLKTYKNVNTDIFNNSTSAENWTTWCLERYKCNSTNNVSNVTKDK